MDAASLACQGPQQLRMQMGGHSHASQINRYLTMKLVLSLPQQQSTPLTITPPLSLERGEHEAYRTVLPH